MGTMAQVWDGLLRRRARRTLSVALPAPGAGAAPIAAGAGYFQLRLAEMFLRDERWLTQERVPATLFLCEFKYGQQDARIPFFVSNQLLAGLTAAGKSLDKTRVRFQDTKVVGPVPYLGNDVAVFAGLFRTVIQDNRKVLFSVFEKLFASAGAALGPYVQLADKVTDELFNSVGLGDVECVLAERNVFGTARRPLASGYLALLDCEEATLGGRQLAVVDGSLHVADGAGTKPVDFCDYCLLSMETLETRNDFTTLPFHAKWREVQELLIRRRVPEAKAALMECQAALLHSDDLTQDHKYRLIEFYQAAFYRDQQLFADREAPTPIAAGERTGTRAAGAMRAIQELEQLARRKPKQLRDSVLKIRDLADADLPLPPSSGLAPWDGEADEAWEQAIARHLRGGPAPTDRKALELLTQTLTTAMVSSPRAG